MNIINSYKWLGSYYIGKTPDNFSYELRKCDNNKLMLSPAHANRFKRYHDPSDRPVHIPDISSDTNVEVVRTKAGFVK